MLTITLRASVSISQLNFVWAHDPLNFGTTLPQKSKSVHYFKLINILQCSWVEMIISFYLQESQSKLTLRETK